ncbi:class I SAM-dependent methyltransferase [Azotobacter chroococcum]|uniref:class I SAM-dependent methyltransferase n=1 Tax=Azotobacter chroococcum TaxID=353 RepID=UPI00197ACF6F|nr:class I SAM-dependent methyltransferase [Azotobacter chroococcum]
MDLNPDTLAFAAQRIARHAPKTCRRNVLEPIAFSGEGFDSVGVNYLLHCLPGSLAEKAVVFDHLKALMNPGAVIFGSALARGLMAAYNRKGIFSNREDDLETLQHEPGQRFREVSVEVLGCAALFSGRA